MLLVLNGEKHMLAEPNPRVNLTDKLRQPVFQFLINFTSQNDFHDFLGDVYAPAGCWLQAAGWMPAAGCCLLAAAGPLGRSAAQPLSRSAAQPLSRPAAQPLSRSVEQQHCMLYVMWFLSFKAAY